MDNIFSSYQYPLDSLVFDSVMEPGHDEPFDMETRDSLELWTNVQFTHDVKPGTGLHDNSVKSPLSSASSQESINASSSSSSSNITYESLANYLDFELPQQQITPQLDDKNKQQQQLRQQSRLQLLLPKIPLNANLEEITKVLFSSIPSTASTTTTSKIPVISTKVSNKAKVSKEKTAAEEDKRRRNTAASARFRIKKKQREQSMEKTVREMTEKSTGLENRVKELELEIKFLRGLLIEKKQEKDAE
ncbi:hypothetical protein [Parasitella parasitica]|uniref:BZIP domain-containing protein n=1 Tax=Parasitella parasitica TaxID=35722 RepID=A0A0B7NHL1_9FUNG|nr:hypothetical protein [Parasitella parasitica]